MYSNCQPREENKTNLKCVVISQESWCARERDLLFAKDRGKATGLIEWFFIH